MNKLFKLIDKTNLFLNKLNKFFIILFLLIPIVLFSCLFKNLYYKNNSLFVKNKELIFLENEYKNIVSSNEFVLELEKSNNYLKTITEEIDAKNNILYDNFKRYKWENIDSVVADNFKNTKIYMNNKNEILLYGNENFLDILYKISEFEIKYPKYNFDFFTYDGYDKSYKFRINNLEKDQN